MMDNVLQAILDYVQTPQTDYALLITGPWGCGKTYFWKKVVEPRLKKVKCNGKPYHPLYSSLYGCQSTKDIDTQLFFASYPHLRNKWTTRLSTVGGHALQQVVKVFTRFELPAIDLRWLVNTKHAVLCFDDLERTQLPMTEALGYINTFVEHEFVKTIILCNEDEIKKDDRETYNKMKEKVVGFSRSFKADYNKVLKSLIAEYKDNSAFSSFMKEYQELISQLFHKSETHNIRTLRRFISLQYKVFEVLVDGNIKVDDIAKQIIYALEPTACEFYSGRANADKFREIHSLNMIAVAGVALSRLKKEKSYEKEFVERYIPEKGWHEVIGCPPICEFLLTGYLDRPQLLQWAQELTQPPDEKVQRIKQLLHDAREMEDEEFVQTASQVLDEVEAGEIEDTNTYLGLYDWFEWFSDNGLITMNRQQVLDKFINGLDKAQTTGRLKPEPHFKLKINHPMFASKTDEGRTLRQHIIKACERVLHHEIQERVQTLASYLQEDASGFIDALYDPGESGLLFTPVFQELDADDTAKRILALPNRLKWHFGMALHERYIKRPPSAEFVTELPVLTRMKNVIQQHFPDENAAKGKKNIPMSLLITKEIVAVLDKVIDRLQQVGQQNEATASATVEDQPSSENNPDMPNDEDENA